MKKGFLLILVSLAFICSGYGQDEFTLSEKHLEKLGTITDSTKRVELRAKYFKKDSSKQVRKWAKQQVKTTVATIAEEQLGVSSDSTTPPQQEQA